MSLMTQGTRIYALELFCEFLVQQNDLQMVKRKKKDKKHFPEAGVPMTVNAAECYSLEGS